MDSAQVGAFVPGFGMRLATVAALAFIVAGCVDATSGLSSPTTPASSAATPSTSAAAQAPTPSQEPTPGDASSTSPPRSQQPSIGYISLDETRPFVRSVSASIRAAAASAGIELFECDSGWSRAGVADCADQLADAGVHGVISFQPFPDLAADVCAAFGDAPVVGVVFSQGSCEVSRLTIDQHASGQLAGEAVGDFASERWDCEVNAWISLESSDADPDGRARMQGYRDGYETHCPLPEQSFTLDDAASLVTAQTQVAGLLPSIKGKPDIVVGLNEDAILGAMAAAEASGREKQLWYSGQLADASIRGHIACDEHYIASVAQHPERFGTPAVETLLAAMDGREVPPRLDAELELVTAANVRELFPDTPSCDD